MENTSNIVTNTPQKGLVTDLHESLVGKEIWTHARNAQLNSHLGQSLFLQNEPATKLCVDLPYPAIGFVKILNERWAVFLSDDINSEIGIFDEKACSYETLVNDPCLNFKRTNPIQGISKQNYDCTESIYWTDNLNHRRFLNLSKVPKLFKVEDDTCETKVYTNKLDCEGLLLEPNITVPSISPTLSGSGNLKNGVYEFAIAYSQNGVRVTEFYSVSKPVRVWSHTNAGQSISLSISKLDRNFDEYELAVMFSENEVVNYRSLGIHSTATSTILVSNITRPEDVVLDLRDIIVKRPRYPYASIVTSNDQYALWADVTTRAELNYQKQAMNITAQYVVYRVPEDYYLKGGIEVGYERDEVYAFGIQWLYKDGSWSPVYHIPGRKSTNDEVALASGRDVYEHRIDPNNTDEIKVWQVENTADLPVDLQSTDNLGKFVVKKGNLAYWESTDTYPNNTFLFGDDKCTPIRHHKTPDNSVVPNHPNIDGYIDVLGFSFDNIEKPKNADGTYNTEVVGYRILRADRKNDRSVIAKGLISNVRSYKETDGREVFYSNYPYNDLGPDNFLSSTQTIGKAGGERSFAPLNAYKNDRFNFHSPHALFANVSLGDELKIYNETVAEVKGRFEEVYKHPKQKLLTQFDLYFALILGALDGYYAIQGRKCTTIIDNHAITLGSITTPSGPTPPNEIVIHRTKQEQACDDALSFTSSLTVNNRQLRAAERILRTLAKVGVFAYFTLQTAQKVLDIISNFSPWQQYGLQYNSESNFNKVLPVPKGYKRRHIEYYQYIRDGINTVESTPFNNYKRETSVFLRLNEELIDPKTIDNTRRTLTDFGIANDKFKTVNSTASMYHVGVKRRVPNQYGSLDGIRYYDTGFLDNTLTNVAVQGTPDILYKTSAVLGGDTFINKLSIKRSHHYFSLFLNDVPDGYILDYRNYRNVGYPRYWIDTTPYDLSGFIALRPNMNRTPANKHNLDNGSDSKGGVSVVHDRYFYLFNSGVLNFYVESDFNLDLRDWRGEEPTFYSRNYSDLSQLFRADKILNREEFLYDKTFSKELTENVAIAQSTEFDPSSQKCQTNIKNRVIYSLPAHLEQKADNWRNYLALNYHDFAMADFGQLTNISAIDNQQFMFLFDKSSPYVTIGRDQLQLDGSGKKITIGDGGLFERDPRPVSYTDNYYGNSQSKWAFNVTQFGIFYPSQRQGRVFKYSGQLDDIARNGMHFWFKNYLPSKLQAQFPSYDLIDNPVIGTSVQTAFDGTNEIYYICKKDYAAKSGVTYDPTIKSFKFGSKIIQIGDPLYFDDASWTISYDPKANEGHGAFISFHDWHPDWTLQSEKRFLTVKNNAIWKHNERWDKFCNFYNVDYPFEVELLINNGPSTEVLRSLEYYLDYGKYFSEGKDFHQILDGNFDDLIVYNNEQCSGLRRMVLQNKKDVSQLFNYPRLDLANELIVILYNKEEQKHRVNQFDDIVRDRGEFTHNNYPIWLSSVNGYTKELNPVALDLNKPVQHRKKFRGLWHKVLLRKLVSGENKLIYKFNNAKEGVSFR